MKYIYRYIERRCQVEEISLWHLGKSLLLSDVEHESVYFILVFGPRKLAGHDRKQRQSDSNKYSELVKQI